MTSPRPGKFVAVVFGFLFSFVLALAAPIKFEIPAQPAPAALKAFVKQSSLQVVFDPDTLREVQGNAVQGEFEPAAALTALLQGTGVTAAPGKGGIFVVKKPGAEVTTGSIEGYVRAADSGRGVAGARVALAGTDLFVLTDKRGRFTFEEAPIGDQELHITAEGMQNTKVTDVTVKAGHRHTLSSIAIPAQPAGVVQLDTFVVSAKKNDGVIELDPYSVYGARDKPFTTANVDIPRTINDAQPYYIYDAKAIDRSGSANIEDFLKYNLTMNAVAETSGQLVGSALGNSSSINLRGLGADKTLVLVNGRRMPGVQYVDAASLSYSSNQPDINGIPLSAIDRIEVLPSSASGIYGGSAIGGVVNVVLKNDYRGGELRTTYDNTWDTDAPRRTISAAFGMALEGGRTHVMLTASFSDAQSLLLQDRRELFDRGIATILKNRPAALYSATNPFLGASPNIANSSSSATTLTLDDGTVIPARSTHIPAGTSSTTPIATLNAGLIANAGIWNLNLPASTQSPTGLLRSLNVSPKISAMGASVRRQMGDRLELFVEYARNKNRSNSIYNVQNVSLVVPAAAVSNPFRVQVRVSVPSAAGIPISSESVTDRVTIGAIAKLPRHWTGELDYTHSSNQFDYLFYNSDNSGRSADILNGTLNPFVDTLQYPLDLRKYAVPVTWRGSSSLDDFALRASGPFWSLPWGEPTVTLGAEHRIENTPENKLEVIYPISTSENNRTTFFARRQATTSGYGEATIPLLARDRIPLIHSLDLQLSGRSERYEVDTGTTGLAEYLNQPEFNFNFGPTLNGNVFRAKADYVSSNYTIGFKYQPTPQLTLRVSRATAFLPPTPEQLGRNPVPDPDLSTVTDPTKANVSIDVQTRSGGNPDLAPQSSSSSNLGLIWEPKWPLLDGLRFNAEYYRIEQSNAISSLTPQQFVDLETAFPGRVTRDATGQITMVDASLANLFKRTTEGWDVSMDYRRKTMFGTFTFQTGGSVIMQLKQQVSLTLPNLEYVNFPSAGGAAKYKANATLLWDWHSWNFGWSARYFGSYNQRGAPGDPITTSQNFVVAQGSATIPSQTYHDLFVGYAFSDKLRTEDKSGSAFGANVLNGVSIRMGVRNVFNTLPPVDIFYSSFYLSPYGDSRLRSYSISVRKEF